MSDIKVTSMPFRAHWWFPLSFWIFIVTKWVGTSLVTWSWWWVFLPMVPIIGQLILAWGL